jgi:hypothetical protein
MTPICDLIAKLLSRGTSPLEALELARPIEAAGTNARGSTEVQRERWRLKKERQRARRAGLSPGDKSLGYTSTVPSTNSVSKKKNKNPGGTSPGDIADDWPADYVEQFWKAFPPYRRQAKVKVGQKLARIRASKVVTWAVLFGGELKFAATEPGDFAPAPIVWLNDGRWDREYGPQRGRIEWKSYEHRGPRRVLEPCSPPTPTHQCRRRTSAPG